MWTPTPGSADARHRGAIAAHLAALPTGVAMRRAAPDDAPALQRACWPEWPIGAVRDFLERMSASAARGRGYPAAALHEGAPIGFGQLTLWRDAAEIGDLIVAPAWRSRGVGTALVAHLLDKARAWGLARVEIGAALSNPRALALYQRLGFAPQRVIDIQLNGGAPEPVMYLAMALEINDGPHPRGHCAVQAPARGTGEHTQA